MADDYDEGTIVVDDSSVETVGCGGWMGRESIRLVDGEKRKGEKGKGR